MRRSLVPNLLYTRRFSALPRQIGGQLSRRVPVGAIVRQLALAFMPRPLIALNRRLGASRNQQVPPWLDARRVGDPPARFAVGGRDLWRGGRLALEIGRASGRGRGENLVGGVSFKKKKE